MGLRLTARQSLCSAWANPHSRIFLSRPANGRMIGSRGGNGGIVIRHPVQEKVRAIQRRAWRLRAVCAGGLWLSGVLGAVFLAGLADYCLRLDDTGVRLLSSAAVLAVCGWCLWRFVVPVFVRRLSELEVAQRIEQRFPQLCDRLSSAVAFLGQSEAAAGGRLSRTCGEPSSRPPWRTWIAGILPNAWTPGGRGGSRSARRSSAPRSVSWPLGIGPPPRWRFGAWPCPGTWNRGRDETNSSSSRRPSGWPSVPISRPNS